MLIHSSTLQFSVKVSFNIIDGTMYVSVGMCTHNVYSCMCLHMRVCREVMHAGWCALAWAGENTVHCFHVSDFLSSLWSYRRLCLCWGKSQRGRTEGDLETLLWNPTSSCSVHTLPPFSPGLQVLSGPCPSHSWVASQSWLLWAFPSPEDFS